MKKTSKIGLVLIMVLTFVFTSPITVSAKPIDNGKYYFAIIHATSLWQDDTSTFWDFIFYDYFIESDDYFYVYGFDPDVNEIIISTDFTNPITSNVNFRKGIATYSSVNLNLTVLFDLSNGEYTISGTRRDGNLTYAYSGPATIKGTVMFNGTTYTVDGTISGDKSVLIKSEHSIEK
ncbi:MAG TPA: hypothetical protein VFH18_05235 [Erysipelotrichaceae bacterium]|nr:hypothetical protein [Erysipelotrichaceae bacterium]